MISIVGGALFSNHLHGLYLPTRVEHSDLKCSHNSNMMRSYFQSVTSLQCQDHKVTFDPNSIIDCFQSINLSLV